MSRGVSQRPRIRTVAAVSALTLGLSAALAGMTFSSACTSTVAVNASLVSGIFITPDELNNTGTLVCGTDAGDVYKYVAIVINNSRDIAGAGVFDCFADVVFGNLPGTDAGSLNFAIWVYVYDQADFNTANADNALVDAVTLLNRVNQPDGSVVPVPISVVPDGGTAAHGFPAALSTVCLRPATWVTTCSAASQPGVQFQANCNSLKLESTVPSSCNLDVELPDGSHPG
jgi:hypothetical protein